MFFFIEEVYYRGGSILRHTPPPTDLEFNDFGN